MNVSLTQELEKAVKAKVASGLYNNASEIIREALRETFRRERENNWLQREAAIGFAQLEAGQVLRVKSKKEFMALVREGAFWGAVTSGDPDVAGFTEPGWGGA